MSNYWESTGIAKRLNNLAVYLFCAIASLFIPVAIDKILYKVLKEQFQTVEMPAAPSSDGKGE